MLRLVKDDDDPKANPVKRYNEAVAACERLRSELLAETVQRLADPSITRDEAAFLVLCLNDLLYAGAYGLHYWAAVNHWVPLPEHQ